MSVFREFEGVTVKTVRDHSKECQGVNQDRWTSPFWFPNGFRGSESVVGRDSRGDKRSDWTRWLVFQCNDSVCKGEWLAKEEWLTSMIQKHLEQGVIIPPPAEKEGTPVTG